MNIVHFNAAVFSIVLITIAYLPSVEAHQLFNEEERNIGGYKIQVATDPEIPGPDNPARLLFAVTDSDANDLEFATVGIKIFKNDVLVHEFPPQTYRTGHFEKRFTFSEPGVYIFQVDVFIPSGNVISAKFNVGIIQTFGYIFYSMVIIGATFPPTLLGIILYMKRRQAKRTAK